jgi:hypothetical protein
MQLLHRLLQLDTSRYTSYTTFYGWILLDAFLPPPHTYRGYLAPRLVWKNEDMPKHQLYAEE